MDEDLAVRRCRGIRNADSACKKWERKMTNTMFDPREMALVHRFLRREYALLPGAVRAVADGDRERAAAVAEHIAFMDVALSHHHGAEDDYIWPLLLERCAEDLKSHVHVMEAQHDAVAALEARVAECREAWTADPSAAARDALAIALYDLLAALHEHLGAEEQHVVPLIVQHVTGDEWGEALQKISAEVGPETFPLTFGMMMYEGDPELIEAILAGLPGELAAVVRETGPQLYAARAEAVYGTATPPKSSEV